MKNIEFVKEFQQWVTGTSLTLFKTSCYDYVRWQNKATDYYISARLLYSEMLISPSVFCAFQAVENLMKATIMFYSDVRYAESFEHRLKRMEGDINNKIVRRFKKAKKISIPGYFVHESRFQSLSRYPRAGKGIGVGAFVLEDLDRIFFDLISLVPFQFNTKLLRILFAGKNDPLRRIIIKDNAANEKLCKYLEECQVAETADKTVYKLYKEGNS